MVEREKPCPVCEGRYKVHGVRGAKPIHKDFPNVLIARSDNHWMFNVWIRGANGKSQWIAWIPERGLDTYIKALRHARELQEIGGLMPPKDSGAAGHSARKGESR